jgi:hypothetical protein
MTVQLDPKQLQHPVLAVVKLMTQPPGVLQQVVLRPDKVAGHLIRLGETRGDEARCWISCEHVGVVMILGRVKCLGVLTDENAEWVQDTDADAVKVA